MPRPYRRLTEAEKTEILRLRKVNPGWTVRTIAEELGCNYSATDVFLRRAKRNPLDVNAAKERGASTLRNRGRNGTASRELKRVLGGIRTETVTLITALRSVLDGIDTALQGIQDADTHTKTLRMLVERNTEIRSLQAQIEELNREIKYLRNRVIEGQTEAHRKAAEDNARLGLERRI